MTRRFFIDLESQSELDVRKVGPYVYSRHPSTKILCMAHAMDSEPVRIWRGFPSLIFKGGILVAHNVDFEREMLTAAGLLDGTEVWEDTAAMAAAMSLPRSLEDLGAFFGHPKDMEGNRVMMQLCRPRKPSADNPDRFWTPETKPEAFERLYQYCASDVEVMRKIHARLLPMSDTEREIAGLTSQMNQRGVTIDLASIPPALDALDEASRDLAAEFRQLTGCPVKSYAKVAKVLGLPDVRKVTVRKTLRRTDIPATTRRALDIFLRLARSSTAKLQAMQERAPEGVLRGAMVYAGAERTGRWSSMGVQLQNIPRGLGKKTDEAFAALHAQLLGTIYDDPVGTMAEMLRGFLVGPFVAGDFAHIEARTLAWLAGQEDLLKTFREHGDPYCEMATKIYGRAITKADKDERFLGKTVVLGCGYGLGAKKFRQQLDEVYDVAIDEPFAEKVIKTYRRANPAITKLWEKLEGGFRYVIKNRSKCVQVGPVRMGTTTIGGEFYAFIELPSGRRMYYARAQLGERVGEDSWIGPQGTDRIRYWGRNIYNGGNWELVSTYGGKIAENVTQAVARDVMAESMLRLAREGFDLRFTVHDEVVALLDPRLPRVEEEFKRIMELVPTWAKGLPIEAEVFTTHRYRK